MTNESSGLSNVRSNELLDCLSCWFHLIPQYWKDYCDTSKASVDMFGKFSCICYEAI